MRTSSRISAHAQALISYLLAGNPQKPDGEFMRFLRKKRNRSWLDVLGKSAKGSVRNALIPWICFLAIACHSSKDTSGPSISFMRIPPAQAPGPDLLGHISGRVVNGKPGMRIVLYARSSTIW
jgi:hypothetical protein